MDEIARGNGRDIVLQAFHFNLVKTQGTGTIDGRLDSWYAILTRMVPEIAALGFTIVYLPPPWRDDSRWEHDSCHGGGEGYFWHDFDLNSRYGSKDELTSLVSELHRHGLKAIVDLVPNHRDARLMQRDIWEYPGPCWRRGGNDSGAGFLQGDFDLALSHPVVHERIRLALEEMMDDCGVDGWRWDFVWGYDTDQVVSWIRGTAKEEYFSMGEYWQADGARSDDPMVAKYGPDERDRIIGWAKDANSCAFDVILKREIQTGEAANLRYGLNASSVDGERELMVTYVDNHDTGASPFSAANGWGQRHWECPPDFKSQAYAFILTMPGVPCVYWPDCFDWGFKEQIRLLIRARVQAGIVASSRWVDLKQYTGLAGFVCNEEGEEMLAVSIGSNFTHPGMAWKLACENPRKWSVWIRRDSAGSRNTLLPPSP